MEKQKQNEVQKVPENNKENQLQSLQNIAKVFQSGKVSPEQKQSGIDYLLKFAQVESKYENQKEHIKNDLKYFLEASMQNRLYTHLGEYNIKKFDVDKNGQIDSKEEQDYGNALREAITQIVLLGGINNFSQIHYDSDSKDGFSNADKWLASKIDLGNHILGEKGDKRFAESTLQKLGEISEEELHKMQETKFQPTSKESWKQLGLLLAKEFGDGVEDVLRFLGNIPSGMILIPRYLKYRVDINSSDEVTKTTGEIKIKELTSENTSLVLLDLLGEQGVELIKKLGEMLTSGKQGDIAMMMVTIAGLVALGGGATKLGLNLARKSAVKSARIAGREARVAGETTSRTTRQGLKKGAQKTGKFAEVAGRVDDIIGGAGIGHLTGAYGGVTVEKIKKAQEKSGVSYEVVMENAKLGDTSRLKKAQEFVGELSQEQKDMILFIHNHISKGVYQNEFGDLRKMLEELGTVGFSREQSRILMENGILGSFDIPQWLSSEVDVIMPSLKGNKGDIKTKLHSKGIHISDDDGFLQLTEQEVAKISTKLSVLKELVESGLNVSRIDQVKYISSLSDEIINGLLEGNKLKRILGLGIRVDTYVYKGTIQDLLKISKLSLQDVNNFLGNEFIIKLKNDGYDFSIDSIVNTLPSQQDYSILRKWAEYSGKKYLNYKSEMNELKEDGLTMDGLKKIIDFSQKYDIDIAHFFGDFGFNLRLVKILSSLDEITLKQFFRKGGFERLKEDIFLVKDADQIRKISQMSDKKIDLLLRIRELGVFPQKGIVGKIGFDINDYIHIHETELQRLLHINDIEKQRSILEELIKVKGKSPDFMYQGEQNLEEFLQSYKNYLDGKQIKPVLVDRYNGNEDWKKFVNKMFRIGEYENPSTIHVSVSQGTLAREWKGFYMNQTIGDCYLIAAMNAMRKNPHFIQDLYKNLKYNQNPNPLKSTYGYTFPDGEYVEVSLKDLRVEVKKGEKDIEKYLAHLSKNESKLNDLALELLQVIERRGKITDRGFIELGNIELPYIDFQSYIIEKKGVRRVKFPEDLIQNVKQQIQDRKGPYYELAVSRIGKDEKFNSVDAPLGYKILEALYAKKIGQTKLGIEGGVSSSVLNLFLSKDGWRMLTNNSFGKIDLSSQINRVYSEYILNNFDSGNYIVTTSVNGIKGDGVSAYFSYGENDMASGHAYSVVGYDKTRKIVQVVNPWDNTNVIDIPLDDFFKVFDDISIFEKVNIKQSEKIIPIEVIRKPTLHNLESILQETGLNKIQFQQLFGMLGAKHQDIKFLDDGRVSIKLRDATDTYYSIVFDPNLKTYKYISAAEPPNRDFLGMQEYYAGQIGCKSIDFRTQSLLGNEKSFDYLKEMFELGFKYKDNNINELLFATFSEFLKTDLGITLKIFYNLDDVIKSRDGRKIFFDFLKKLESKDDYTFFRYDMEKKIP